MIYNRPEYWLAKTETVVPYLTFSSYDSFTLEVEDRMSHWEGILEYSTDKATWDMWDGTTTLFSAMSGSDNVLYLRGSGNTIITGDGPNCRWVVTGSDIKCIGNIENLLDYTTVAFGMHPAMADYCYRYMFESCTALIQAPALPATELTNYCYSYMFESCNALTQAPALPATKLADFCYSYMFYDCTSLKFSEAQGGEYTVAYRIPTTGSGVVAPGALTNMFGSTGGTFIGTPKIDTTYYLSNTNTVV